MKKILSVLLIAMLVVVGCGKKNSSEEKTSNGGRSSKTEKVCNIERDHIHIEDLSKEELDELNITYSLGMVRTFTDSKIKAIVFNGKEYDYKEVVAALTNYDKMTNFIAQNTDFLKFSGWMDGASEEDYYVIKDLTPDKIAYYMSYAPWNNHEYTYEKFYIVGEGESINEENPRYASTDRYIEVSWEFPRSSLTEHNSRYYTIDTSYYGKSHEDHDYILFSTDGLDYGSKSINEDFGFILEDGRYVHSLAINTYDDWYLVDHIYVTSRTQEG